MESEDDSGVLLIEVEIKDLERFYMPSNPGNESLFSTSFLVPKS